ncbi:MAG: dihydrodipicolinate synthase family protein [Firmicutes bacterium]|nr:dihydrodipicolinate synthase family protein [Bacillota bacterium]
MEGEKLQSIKGVIPVVPIIFEDNGELELDQFRSVIDHLSRVGTKALTIFGIASEFYKLSDSEKDKLLQTFINHVNNRMITIASITSHSTENAVKDAVKAQSYGINALMILPPFFLSPGPQEIVNHISEIASAVRVPIIIQYTPDETGVRLPANVFVDIAEKTPNEVYVKIEGKSSNRMIAELHEAAAGRIGLLTGNGGLHLYEALERGAIGVMPGCAWVEIYQKIIMLYSSGEKDKAFTLYNRLVPFLNFIGQSGEMFVRFEKISLVRRGITQSDYCRMPGFHPDARTLALFDIYYRHMVSLLEECR